MRDNDMNNTENLKTNGMPEPTGNDAEIEAVTPTEDDFIIGKGFKISEEPDMQTAGSKHKGTKSGKKKKKGMPVAVKAIIWILSILIVSGGLAYGIIFSAADYMGLGFVRGEQCVIEIEKGSSTVKIAEQLKECGAIKMPLLFRIYTRLKHYDGKYYYGMHTVGGEMGYAGLAGELMTQRAYMESNDVMIPESASIANDEAKLNIASVLETAGVCTKADFLAEIRGGSFDYDFIKDIPDTVIYRLEGYLFPDTYDLNLKYDTSKQRAHAAVDLMLKEMSKKIEPYRADIEKSGYSIHEVLTLASMIELEAGGSSADNKAKVAAVFYNRLKHPEKGFATLGSDPTMVYPNKKEQDDRYNTYKCTGLPIGPICSPSIDSIKAAVYPKENWDYYYFVTDKSSQFYFNKTLNEHNSTIAKLKREGKWLS